MEATHPAGGDWPANEQERTTAVEDRPAGERSVRNDYADWPFGADSEQPQPWEHKALGIDPNAVDPGEPDDVSPVPIDHAYPILTSGSAGTAVLELGQLLKQAGYETSVSRGENPLNVLDGSVMAAAQQFRRDYGVREDPTAFGGDNRQGNDQAENHVGPYTWEALLRVNERDD